MLRKILAFLLSMIMLIVGIPISANAKTEETPTTDTTIIETSDRVVAKQEVEGSFLACEYVKYTEEYYLCVDETKLGLDVTETDGEFFVTVTDYSEDVYETKVVAQAVTYLTLTAGFVTATMIYAARDIIVAGVSAVVRVGSEVVNVSLNAIANTINKVTSRKITTSNVSAESRASRTAAITAVSTIRKSKENNENRYWTAEIKNGQVVIGTEISKDEAIIRLKKGYDVFATTESAAQKVCLAASPRKRATPHEAHVKAEGYYYHYHPVGLKWYKNSKYQPHCWYII